MGDIDEKEKHTFLELQDKIIDAHARSKTLTHQNMLKERGFKESMLITEELKPMPDDTKTYRAVGRAYFCSPKSNILSQLEKDASQCKSDIEHLTTSRKVVEKELQEAEKNMREFLESSPALAAKLVPG
ncbi:hypothetical protein BSKO_01052 [Bryopsis sp. KO-2023]|nr:hypothetical protein BSKO_01052 [Bryopsis sp. KO-2023]